ncbi:MAG: arsenic resistance N-acetyltransferase ArsN2 [Bacteroidota bacterium]
MKKSMQQVSSIRLADEEDLPMIVQLLAQEQLPTEDVGKHLDLYLWEEQDEIVAIGGWERYHNIGLLRSIVCVSDKRGKGNGRQWVSQLMEESKQKQLTDLYLLTTTAAPFFEKMGFSEIDRSVVPDSIRQSAEFSSLCPSSAVVMHQRMSE